MAKILIAYADWTHVPERKKQNTYGGIGYYRQIKPSQQIKGHEVRVVGQEILTYGNSLEDQWDTIFKQHDVFWTSYFSNGEAAAAMFFHAQKHGKKVIIDVDDNYLDVPESNLMYDKFKATKKDRAILSTILSFADALTVSTEPLKERLYNHIKTVHGIEKPIFVIPNFNDKADWDFPKAKHDEFVIGYTGSNSHQDDLRMIMPSMAEVMKKHKHVKFELIGAIGKDKIKEYFAFAGFNDDCLSRISLKPATPTFKEYPKYLAEQGWNIGLAPLVDTGFTRAKSHIKWMEYSMYEIPVLASRVYPYFMELAGKDTIIDGNSGFLLKPKEWTDALDDAVRNYDKIKFVGENAKKQIEKQWQYVDSGIDEVVNTMLKAIGM